MILKLLILIILVIILVFYNLNLYPCNIENFESKNNDILVLIFSCKKYESRIEILKKIGYLNYLTRNGVDYLVVTGDENLDKEYNLDLTNKKLVVKEKDTYAGLPYKVVKTLYSVNNDENLNYEYIIKSDDDCVVNIEKILNNKNKIEGEDYVGRLNNFKHNYNPNWNGLKNKSKYYGPYMNGATGYILSNKALKSISSSKEQNSNLLKDELYEDKLIGDILRLNGFKFKQHKFWYSIPKETKEMNNVEEFINKNKQVTTFYGPQ
tara:strand:+ start:146 stop:940 length:795 start_codon:yes stop_codon:yes gene_type:complete